MVWRFPAIDSSKLIFLNPALSYLSQSVFPTHTFTSFNVWKYRKKKYVQIKSSSDLPWHLKSAARTECGLRSTVTGFPLQASLCDDLFWSDSLCFYRLNLSLRRLRAHRSRPVSHTLKEMKEVRSNQCACSECLMRLLCCFRFLWTCEERRGQQTCSSCDRWHHNAHAQWKPRKLNWQNTWCWFKTQKKSLT